ncbi:hypothetical protein [Cellulophaga sp. L1A9]|uniref:hypothetical protein n=1 Tax=Cellulophaga sp. L1A9 TaxID=2686362 RepID=UPI00131CB9CC|nr:hypothetical protein [Cellulophaga sp. L1A9]
MITRKRISIILTIIFIVFLTSCKKTDSSKKASLKTEPEKEIDFRYSDLIGKKFLLLEKKDGELFYHDYRDRQINGYFKFETQGQLEYQEFSAMESDNVFIVTKEKKDNFLLLKTSFYNNEKDRKEFKNSRELNFYLKYDKEKNLLYFFENDLQKEPNIYIDEKYLNSVKIFKDPKKYFNEGTEEELLLGKKVFNNEKFLNGKKHSPLFEWKPSCDKESNTSFYVVSDSSVIIFPNKKMDLVIEAIPETNNNLITLHLKRTKNTDMHVPSYWKGYSTDSIVGKMGLLGNGKAEFLWLGLYNEKTKERDFHDIQFIIETGVNPMVLENCGK